MGANILEQATEPTLVGLPTEVLVTVASFLDLKGGEMRRLADAVGPQPAKAIRFAYLNANLTYLKYLHDLLAERSDRARCRAVSAGLRQWIVVNRRWRECLDAYGGGVGVRGVLYDAVITAREGKELPKSMPWPHQVIYEESEYDDGDDDDGGGGGGDGRLKLFEQVRSGHIAATHLDNGLFRVKCSSRDLCGEEPTSSIIVGIKTIAQIDLVSLPLHTLSFLAAEKDDAKNVRLMNYYFAHFFLNASLAIDLGLAEILEHLIEVKKVSPNSGSSVGIHRFFRGTRCQPLFLSALVHGNDSAAFKYLLSRPNFGLKPGPGRHPLHCLRQLKSSRRGGIPLPSLSTLVRRIRTLVRRVERLDMDSVNCTRKSTIGTPLYDVLFSDQNLFLVEEETYDDVDVALVNLYLSLGATTTHFSIDHIPDKTEHQRTVTKLLRAASQDERDDIMKEYETLQTSTSDETM